jgi:tetratricopeptide (TPR) repeat protein
VCFDFALQIPANAFLFTLLLAVACRIVQSGISPLDQSSASHPRLLFPAIVGAVAGFLAVAALRQEYFLYPYSLTQPTSVAEARERVFSHPAHSSGHLALFRLLEEKVPLTQRLNEVTIALWLDPLNPYIRDLYATGLFQEGQEEDALREITRSVSFAPSPSAHSYVNHKLLPFLSAKEQQAIEEGLQQALRFGTAEAVDGLGAFYAAIGHFAEEGKLYEENAARRKDLRTKRAYLLKAALAYVQSKDAGKAEELLRQIIAVTPTDSQPYQYLATHVFAPQRKIDLARAAIAEGIRQGADPYALSFALAEAAQIAGAKEEVQAALLQALAFRPSSFDVHLRLGLFYVQEQNFDRAALSFRKALDLDPRSSAAFYYLGVAEEGRYQFFAAEKAYARAVELAPGNADFHKRYEAFRQKVAQENE